MKSSRALLIIDMLNDFANKSGSLYVRGIESIIIPIKKEIESARNHGDKIIYICDAHDKNDREFRLFPGHAVKGTIGASIIKDLEPQRSDIIIEKKTLSSFYNTELGNVLSRFKIDELIVTGCVINICVLFTSMDAVSRGYTVNVVKDAVIGFNNEDYEFTLKQMSEVFKINII